MKKYFLDILFGKLTILDIKISHEAGKEPIMKIRKVVKLTKGLCKCKKTC